MSSKTVAAILAMLLSVLYGGSVFAQSQHHQHLREGKSVKSMDTKETLNACNSMHQGRQCSMMKHMTGPCRTMKHPDATAYGASVKSKLAITHSQQPHWQKYEIRLKEYYEFTKAMRQNGQVETAPQKLRARAELLQQHANILKTMDPALSKLYVALTPHQRQTADKIIPSLICKM
jgi:LTXXQ motif family protein